MINQDFHGALIPMEPLLSSKGKLKYQSVLDEDQKIPAWIDRALSRAVHPNPLKRYETLSEFVYDLRHPNAAFLNSTSAPLVDRHPVLFWKLMSLGLAAALLALAFLRFGVK